MTEEEFTPLPEEPQSWEEHTKFLNNVVSETVQKIWPILSEAALSVDSGTPDKSGMNCVVTGVCANLLAHYTASMIAHGFEPKEYGAGKAIDNFNGWYKDSLPKILESLKKEVESGER
jgi:hypothetical protein